MKKEREWRVSTIDDVLETLPVLIRGCSNYYLELIFVRNEHAFNACRYRTRYSGSIIGVSLTPLQKLDVCSKLCVIKQFKARKYVENGFKHSVTRAYVRYFFNKSSSKNLFHLFKYLKEWDRKQQFLNCVKLLY